MSLLALTASTTLAPSTVTAQTYQKESQVYRDPNNRPPFGQTLNNLAVGQEVDARPLWQRRQDFIPHADPPEHEMPPSMYVSHTLPPQRVYGPGVLSHMNSTASPAIHVPTPVKHTAMVTPLLPIGPMEPMGQNLYDIVSGNPTDVYTSSRVQEIRSQISPVDAMYTMRL